MAPPHCFRAGQSLVDRVSPEVLICLHPVPVMGTLELYVSHHPSPHALFSILPHLSNGSAGYLLYACASCLLRRTWETCIHCWQNSDLVTDWCASFILHLVINGDKNLSLWQWLTVACSNCVCPVALTCIMNYPQCCTSEKGGWKQFFCCC